MDELYLSQHYRQQMKAKGEFFLIDRKSRILILNFLGCIGESYGKVDGFMPCGLKAGGLQEKPPLT